MQWQIRRNTAPGRSNQPISAPSALAAQRADNFQKFYRAVVSPTHVRVTAGGRIVPNTRAPPQPVFGWMQHKQQSSLDHDVVTWTQGVPLNPLHTSLAGNNPTVTQQPATTTETSTHVGNKPTGLDIGENTPTDKRGGDEPASGTLTDDSNKAQETSAHNFKISPPQQFDVSKPFMYHGQLVCPVPAGFQLPQNAQMLPISMLGNPGMLPGPFAAPPGMFFQPPYPTPIPLQMHLMGQQPRMSAGNEPLQPQILLPGTFPQQSFMPHAGFQGMMHPTPQPLVNITNATSVPQLPPIPTTHANHPPTATKAQLHVLRQHLKYYENQLANNRHQIDERHMNIQRAYISKQIDILQTRLNSQLIQFGSDPRAFRTPSGNGAYDHAAAPHTSSTRQGNQMRHDMLGFAMSQRLPVAQTSPRSSNSRGESRSDVATNKADESQVQTPPNNSSANAQSSSQMDSSSRARLIAAAAKAPPFQPRSLNVHPVTDTKQTSPESDPGYDVRELTNPEETDEEIEARLLAKASYWGAPARIANPVLLPDSPLPASMPRAKSTHESSGRNYHTVAPAFARQSTLSFANEHSATSQYERAGSAEHGVPYLVGYHAPRSDAHVGMRHGQQEEFVYSRELTVDEMRARYLYWGQAPRDLQQGLPKYDGRDFYPPSPVKTSATHEAHLSTVSDVDGASPHNLDSLRLFVEHSVMRSTSDKSGSTRSSQRCRLEDPFHNEQGSSEAPNPGHDTPIDAIVEDDTVSVDSWGLPVEHLPAEAAQWAPRVDTPDFTGHQSESSKRAGSPQTHQAEEGWLPTKASAGTHMNSPSHNTFLQEMLRDARFAPTTSHSGMTQSSPRLESWIDQEYGMKDDSPRRAFAVRAAQQASQSDAMSGNMRKSAPQYRGSAAPPLAPSTVSALASFGSQGPRRNPFAETAFGYALPVDSRSPSTTSWHIENNAPARSWYSTGSRPTHMVTASEYLRRVTRAEQTPTSAGPSPTAGIGPTNGDW